MKSWLEFSILATEGPPATEHAPFSVWSTLPLALVVGVIGWWAIRRFRLPFVGRVFWWTLPATYLGAALIWGTVLFLDYKGIVHYKLMPADYGGTLISAAILAYLIHLWLIPIDEISAPEAPPPERDPGSDRASS